jgi:hypothetical protein
MIPIGAVALALGAGALLLAASGAKKSSDPLAGTGDGKYTPAALNALIEGKLTPEGYARYLREGYRAKVLTDLAHYEATLITQQPSASGTRFLYQLRPRTTGTNAKNIAILSQSVPCAVLVDLDLAGGAACDSHFLAIIPLTDRASQTAAGDKFSMVVLVDPQAPVTKGITLDPETPGTPPGGPPGLPGVPATPGQQMPPAIPPGVQTPPLNQPPPGGTSATGPAGPGSITIPGLGTFPLPPVPGFTPPAQQPPGQQPPAQVPPQGGPPIPIPPNPGQNNPPPAGLVLDDNMDPVTKAMAIQLLTDDSVPPANLDLAAAAWDHTGYPKAAAAARARAAELRKRQGTTPPKTTDTPPPGVLPTSLGTPYLLRTGDIPSGLAKWYTGNGARYKELIPLNPTLALGGPYGVTGWNELVGQNIWLPFSWNGLAKSPPPAGYA